MNKVFASLLSVFVTGLALQAAKPNLLVIYTDEHHYNTLGCYGGKIVETPNIDWLAEKGALCTSFYATTPVCSPSRASFVSGKYPQNTPVVQNSIPLSDEVVTFAEILKREGYRTGFAGKWHLDGDGKPQWQPERKFGFDDNRFMFNRGHWKKFGDTAEGPEVAAKDRKGNPSYGVDGADEKSFATDWLVKKGVEFINEDSEKPFCYMISLPDPHGPNTVRAPYDTMYVGVDVPIPTSIRKTAEQTPKWAPVAKNINPRWLKGVMPPYYGMVKCIDDNVGLLLEALRKKGQLDNTFIVFSSDHGDLCGEHGRANKGVPYEGSARIPFILYGPGKVKQGIRIDQALGCVDFAPTVLSLMGIQHKEKMDGRNASALFKGDKVGWEDFTVLRSTSGQAWVAAVTDDLKLVFSKQDEPWLFDLKKDPDELNNRFKDPAYADQIKDLTQRLMRYGKQFGDPYVKDGSMLKL